MAMPILPRGWVWARLEELCYSPQQDIVDGPFGSNLKASEYRTEGVPVIRLQNIRRNEFVRKNIKHVTLEKAEELGRHSFSRGDIVVTKLGDPLGKACIIPENMEWGIVVADVVRVRVAQDLISRKAVAYAINSEVVSKQLEGEIKGTTRPRVNLNHIRSLLVPLPPFNEQLRIVARVEELFTMLDAGVKYLETVKAQLKPYRQSVLKSGFEGKLTEEWRRTHRDELEPASNLLKRIREERMKNMAGKYEEFLPVDAVNLSELPEGWVWTRIGEVCETTSGGTPSRKNRRYFGGKIPWLKSGELEDGLVRSSEEHITEEGLESSSAKIVPKGAVLIALYGATVGRLGILEIDSAINQAICAILTPNDLDKRFLFWYLMSYRSSLLHARKGGAQPNISQEIVKNTVVPLAPLSEQSRIAEEIERHFAVIDETERTIANSLRQAEKLRQSILKRTFEGNLVPQDPSDESASVLLERIRSLRAQMEQNQKTTKRRKRNDPSQRRLM